MPRARISRLIIFGIFHIVEIDLRHLKQAQGYFLRKRRSSCLSSAVGNAFTQLSALQQTYAV